MPATHAAAQFEVWTSTLEVGALGSNTYGCSISLPAAQCDSPRLSDPDFEFNGTDYGFNVILDHRSGTLVLETSPSSSARWILTLVVDGTQFAAEDAVEAGNQSHWQGADLNWSAGQSVELKLLTPSHTEVPANWSLTPSGLDSGDSFRLIFASSATRDGSSTDIETYNAWIRERAAAGHDNIQRHSWSFRVVGSTAAVDARDNTLTTGDPGVPIYWLGGNKVADDHQDFYDGNWDDEANPKDESGNARDLETQTNWPMTGSRHDGTEAFNTGGTSKALGEDQVAVGRPNSSGSNRGPLATDNATVAKADSRPFYGISTVFRVPEPVNSPPVFPSSTATRTLPENTSSGQNIGDALTATDVDGDTLSYTLLGSDPGSFSIVMTSGQIRTKVGVSYDYETRSSYSVRLRAADGAGGQAFVDVTITVTDVTEPPGTPAAPSVSPASSTSLLVTWAAPSNTGPAISSYDLRFSEGVNGTWMAGPQDRIGTSVVIEELAKNTLYQVQVLATSAEGDSPWSPAGSGTTFSRTGNDPPVFGQSSETRSLAETVGSLTAQAPAPVGAPLTASDGDDDPLEYTLDGTHAGKFTIEPATGQILTKVGESYDRETESIYRVTVKADDGYGGTDTVAVTISVTDETEPPLAPVAPTVTASSRTSIDVSWAAPDNVGRPPVTSYDLRYRAGVSGVWTEDPQGVTVVGVSIADLSHDTSYQVQVLAANRDGDGDWSPSGSGRTDANNAPLFSGGLPPRRIAEQVGRAAVRTAENVGGVVTATDDDGDTLQYSLEGVDASRFTIDPRSAQIRTKVGENYDHEAASSLQVTVRAEDMFGGENRITVTIDVTDEDEPPLALAAPTVTSDGATSLQVDWSAPGSTGRPAVTGYAVRYRQGSSGEWIDGGSGTSGFTLDASIFSLDVGTMYQVQVQATNAEGEGLWSAAGSGSTNTQGNTAPLFGRSSATWTVLEHVGAATEQTAAAVGSAETATDGDSDPLTYSLDGADAGRFTIDSASAQIATKVGQNYDRESNTSYSVFVKADDGEGGTDALRVTIDVTDEPEPPLQPAAPSVSATPGSRTSLDVHWSAPANAGRPSITGYDVQYRMAGTTSWMSFADSPSDTRATIPNLDEVTGYEVQVQANNDEGAGPWSSSGTGTTGRAAPPPNGGGGGGPPPGPGAPTVDSVAAAGRGALRISWSAPGSGASPSSYDVRYIRSSARDKADENWTVRTGVSDADTLRYTLSGLSDSTRYDVQVRAVAGSASGPWSETVAGSTAAAAPPPPPGPAEAGFTTPNVVCEDELCFAKTGFEVVFEETSTGDIRSRTWDFGDGGGSSRRGAEYAWSEPGFYTVTLTVTDGKVESTASQVFLVEASEPAGTCVADEVTRCLLDSRFSVRVDWRTPAGDAGAGKVVRAGTNDSGLFRFFDQNNWEVLIKLLDGCALNQHVWVFGASTTDLGYSIRVTDTVTGAVTEYGNEPGRPASAITDVTAFPEACRSSGGQ